MPILNAQIVDRLTRARAILFYNYNIANFIEIDNNNYLYINI